MTTFAKALGACLLAALFLAGCSDEPNAEGTDDPSATPPSTSAQPTSSPPSPRVPAWQENFSDEQIDAYEAALARWQEYTEKTNVIYKAGKNTPEARAVLREYSMQWQGEVTLLDSYYARGGLREVRPPEPLSWKAQLVRLNKDGTGSVVIVQCTDYRDSLLKQHGKEVSGTKPDHLVTPLIINMSKPEGYDWMVADTDLKDKRSCDA